MVDGSDFRKNRFHMIKEIKYYRKKPVIVQAYQTDEEMIIPTLEGDMKASGEQYPCKPDIFEKTYEPINKDDIID